MGNRVTAAGRVLVSLGATAFSLAAVTALVLALSGAVRAERWTAALDVLRGTAGAVAADDLARLRRIEKADAARALRPGEAELVESWRALGEERERFAARARQEKNALVGLADLAESKRAEIADAEKRWRLDRVAADAEVARRRADLERGASEKIKRVYRRMSATAIAADIEARLLAGRRDEVAALVGAMSDRSAAEVLEAMDDPAARMEIYDALAGRSARGHGGAPE